MNRFMHCLAGACIAGVTFTAIAADSFPSHPVSIITPYAPGGAQDSVARLLSKALAERLGQPVVVENRAVGAGGSIGAGIVAKSPPDGYTLLASIAGIHVINPAITDKRLPYEPLDSWAPISLMVASPLVLVVRSDSPFRSLQELISYARAHPGELSYASAGIGTSLHLAGELLKERASIDLLHVPYKGSAPALGDTLGGRTTMTFGYPASIMEHVRSGKLRMLAVGSAQRLALIPDVPTVAESGVPGYDSDTWTGIVAPAGTPGPIVAKLNEAVNYALEQNRAQLAALGYIVLGGTPDTMRQRIQHEMATITPLVARVMKTKQGAH